jgi:hypothetical protein
MEKPTKRERRKLVPTDLMVRLQAMGEDAILAVHDFIHEEVERRAGRAALAKEQRE